MGLNETKERPFAAKKNLSIFLRHTTVNATTQADSRHT